MYIFIFYKYLYVQVNNNVDYIKIKIARFGVNHFPKKIPSGMVFFSHFEIKIFEKKYNSFH